VSFYFVLVALLGLSFMGGCSLGPSEPQTVRVGAIYPLSGSLASTGVDIRQGVEFAQAIINGEYDLDLPLAREAGLPALDARIEVIFGDHAGDPAQGAAEAQRMLAEENVVALLGSYNSSVTLEASQVAESARVPFLNPDSTSPVLIERGFQWFFRTTADDSIFVQNFYDFLAELGQAGGTEVTPRTLAVVYENSLFGTSVAQLEMAQAGQAGWQLAAEIPYLADTTDVQAEVESLLASDASLVMQSSYASDAILFMQTYKEMGYRPQAILAMNAGFISPAFVDTLGDDANYVLSRDVWALDIAGERQLVGEVNELYREQYGTNLTGNSARAFTGLVVLADAINRAGSTDPEEIRQALHATDIPAEQLIMPWEGVRFDPATGQNVLASGIIVQIQDQAYHTVWPWHVASRELIWPMPDWGE
jgi:branched-chain amino acid transport system substrate-binding protein